MALVVGAICSLRGRLHRVLRAEKKHCGMFHLIDVCIYNIELKDAKMKHQSKIRQYWTVLFTVRIEIQHYLS